MGMQSLGKDSMKLPILMLCIFAVAACGSKSALEKERSKVEGEGWVFVEVVGKERSNAELFTWMESETAKDIGVGIVEDGKQKEKRYPQDAWLYHASIFTSSSGESFALVFRKPKSK